MNIIETHGLRQRYWSGWERQGIHPVTPWKVEVLHGLDLAVPAGSICALLGANGAGKTTLLKVLVNLLRPSAGRATVLGVDSTHLGEAHLAQLGYVSENQKLPDWMNVRQLLDYCRPFYASWDPALERTLLARFALPADRPLKRLSRGMQVKAALLSSLCYRPRLLVLDEPFSGLDPVVREDVTQGLLEAVRQGETTVLVSSHDIEEVERLADRVVLMEAGRLRFTEPTEALLARFRRIQVDQEAFWSAGERPVSWLAWQSGAGTTCFVDSAYDHAATEGLCRRHFPTATVQAHPMTLREIFITLARPAAQPSSGVTP